MPRPLGNDTITLLQPELDTDSVDGGTVFDWDNATETEIDGCSVQPFLPADKLQFEITSDRDYARATWVVFAPSNSTTRGIRPHDRILFLEREYEVFGEIGAWRRLDGSTHHVQIILQTREG